MFAFRRWRVAICSDARNLVAFVTTLLLSSGGLPGTIDAQGVSVVPTILNGNPFRGNDVRNTYTTGDKMSLNVIVDTRGTEIELDAITVSVRFPRGVIRKLVRREFEPPGTGWPTPGGLPFISSAADLPEPVQALLGRPFLTISGSADNDDCPCDEDNGEGMETVVHFLLVDLQREIFIVPGVYHLFQTDWIVTEDCNFAEFRVEITDGPGEGLVALGKPARSFLLDEDSGKVFKIASGLRTKDTGTLSLRCRRELTFIRGDVNVDAQVDITDAVGILTFLFLGHETLCEAAADTDDSGAIDITDSIYLLRFLFLAGKPVPHPYPVCGTAVVETSVPCRRTCK